MAKTDLLGISLNNVLWHVFRSAGDVLVWLTFDAFSSSLVFVWIGLYCF